VTIPTSITVRVPLTIRHRPGRKTIVTLARVAGDAATQTQSDPAVVKAFARAFRWKRMLEEGRYASISEIARSEKIDRGYVGSILRLTLLAPDIIEAILDGRQPGGFGLPTLLQPWPLIWSDQRSKWFVSNSTGRESTASTPAATT
jgi:hypothetical protein